MIRLSLRCSRLLLVVPWLAAGFASPAHAEFSDERPIHHFFNARLLQPGENQVSIAGNYKRGLTDDLEIGTQGLLILSGALNLSLKHRMFERPDWTTAFVFHGGRMQTVQNSDLAVGDADSSDITSVVLYAAAAGIVTTYDIAPNRFLNFGIYDFMLRQSMEGRDHLLLKAHIFSLMLGYDHYFSSSLALTLSYCHSLWLIGQVESDVTDLEININTLTGMPPNLNPSIGFATLTHSWETVNVEGGLAFFALEPFLYANVFWRFF